MTKTLADQLGGGRLARAGCLTAAAMAQAGDVIAQVKSERLETARILFCDQHGTLRGKTIVADALPAAFRDGITVPSTILLKDTSQRTAFAVWGADAGFGEGFLTGASDALLIPDPSTFRILPWAPHSGVLLCDVRTRDLEPIAFASRTVLSSAIDRLATAGFDMMTGLEVEFHIFKRDPADTSHSDCGMPGAAPRTSALTRSYGLLADAHYDALEEVMDALRRTSDAMGLPVRSMEPEFGPSQVEFTFAPAGPMAHADNFALFRMMAKQVCRRMGLHATFMCRPVVDNGAASGWHVHQSILERASGTNVFMPHADGALSDTASGWIAGLLHHAAECCVLTTPSVNGYKRYQPFQLAPERVQWGVDNRGAMIRALMQPGDPASRIENRTPEPAANPYFVFASQIVAGLHGVNAGWTAPPPAESPYADAAEALPKTLLDAIHAFETGTLFAQALGQDFVQYISHLKRAEWARYVSALSEWEQREYFDLF